MNQNSVLHKIFDHQKFSDEEFTLILSQYTKTEFQKNDFLIPYDSVAGYYYFMESGFARSFTMNPEGDDITTKFFSEGDIVIDWHSYFLRSKSRESIQAVTKCTVWKITFEDFMKLFKIEAFREVGRTRLINNYFELKSHSVSMIADPAQIRYLNLVKEKPDIVQSVPLKQIATYLGITDTSLSRIRKEISKKK
jgi:CRP-like cAMP-binding protein